jgi:hypothetical protein
MATLSKKNSNFSKIAIADTGGNILSLNVPQNINASNAVFSNTITTNANILLANITTLRLSGQANLGAVGNLIITGGSSGQTLISNGAGGLSWGNYVGNIIIDGSSNVRVLPSSNISFTVTNKPSVIELSATQMSLDANLYIDGNLLVNDADITGNMLVLGNSDLGSNSNVTMRGGEFGWLLTTDGNGQLFWKDPCQLGCGGGGGGGTIAGVNQIIAGNNITVTPALGTGVVTIDANLEIQPQMQFTAPITGFAQAFSDPNIATFQNNAYALIAVNGVIQSVLDYTITGSTLTITNNLNAGDIVQIGPTGGGGGAIGTGTVTQVGGNGGGIGFSLTGNVTTNGNLVLTVPTASALKTNLGIDGYPLLNYDSSTYLRGDGTWGNFQVTVGSNTEILFNDNGASNGNVNFTFDKVNASMTLNGSATINSLFQTINIAPAGVIDVKSASYFQYTVTAPIVFSVVNTPVTGSASFILVLTNGGLHNITWFGVRWQNGTPPVLSTNRQDVLGFFSLNGAWYGFLIAKAMQ